MHNSSFWVTFLPSLRLAKSSSIFLMDFWWVLIEIIYVKYKFYL